MEFKDLSINQKMTEQKELWRNVTGFENYQVSSLGRVRRNMRVLTPKVDRWGYFYVGLHKHGKATYRSVHRLVASEFIPNPDNLPCINHKNERKMDNNINNLEWCTNAYNAAYGSRKVKVCLCDEHDRMVKVFPSIESAADFAGVSKNTIGKYCIEHKQYQSKLFWRKVDRKTEYARCANKDIYLIGDNNILIEHDI